MKHTIRVGAPYDPSRKSWPEGAAFVYHNGYELLLRFPSPMAGEVAAVGRGHAAIGFYVAGAAVLVLYRFAMVDAAFDLHGDDADDPVAWSDVPADPHRWQRLPPGEERAQCRFVLVDADTGIVRALRVVLLAPGFTAALRAAATAARAAFRSPGAFDLDVAAAEQSMTSAEMARVASHVTVLPPKTDERRDA